MENKAIYMEDEELCTIHFDEAVDCSETCDTVDNLKKCIDNRDEQIKELLNINFERDRIYKKAIDTWGEDSQITMIFEEMAELQKELCKYLRGEESPEHKIAIAEEIADVEIMLEQMKIIFNLEGAVNKHKEYKIFRLAQKLNKYGGKINERR